MEELPLAIQLKLREMPGADTGVQRVDVVLEDGRVVPEVNVVDCTYVDDAAFEAHQVADVRLPSAPPNPRRAFLFIGLALVFVFVLYWILWLITPESVK